MYGIIKKQKKTVKECVFFRNFALINALRISFTHAKAQRNSLLTTMKQIDKDILHIAVPSAVSNVTIPLLGLIDTAITGHLGAATYIGAIAVGASIFSLCYWLFSFLRMGTAGITAQAVGQGAWDECRECLRKAMTIAILGGIVIITLQHAIAAGALRLIDSTEEVERWAEIYFLILVWGAPANLGLSALNGWFIGMQNAKAPMTISIGQNVLNIVASCLLVFVADMGVRGVAYGTLIAQWCGFSAACYWGLRLLKSTPYSSTNQEHKTLSWTQFFNINRDIFLRTLCLIAVMFSFTAFGARFGETPLAVNALLMQLFLFVSYLMDSFAYAAEALGGKMLGAKDREGFTLLLHRLFLWGSITAALFCIVFAVGHDGIIALLTDNLEVRELTRQFIWAAILIPAISLGAFIYDGIFIGTTSTREMLISIAIATAAYYAIALLTTSNTGLWCAFLTYLGARGGIQHLQMRSIIRSRFCKD